MKVAIATEEASLSSMVDSRLGRAPYFVICEVNDPENNWESHQNPNATSGAGVATAQLLANLGVQAVIAGNVGPNAAQVFNAAGIQVFIAQHITARQAVDAFIHGELTATDAPTTQAHSGLAAKSGNSPAITTRLAVATEDSHVAPHFGHCQTYTLVDIAAGSETARNVVANPGHEPGILPGFLAAKGVKYVIAGGMGSRAVELFEQQSINTIVGVSGSVDEAIKLFLAGTLVSGQSMCDH